MFYTIINYSRAVSPRWRLAATQMIDPDNTLLKYCIVNNTDTHAVGWRVGRFTAGQSLPPGFRAARECFGAKKLLSARFSCRTPMFLLLRSCYSAYSCRTSYFKKRITKRKKLWGFVLSLFFPLFFLLFFSFLFFSFLFFSFFSFLFFSFFFFCVSPVQYWRRMPYIHFQADLCTHFEVVL